MKRLIIIIVIVGMVGWAVFDFFSKSNQTTLPENQVEENNQAVGTDETENEEKVDSVVMQEDPGLLPGDLAPNFQLTTLEGETVKLSDYRGERVMLNFWATWCGPCRAEMPDMQKFHEDTDIVILAVNLTKSQAGEVEKVPTFVEDFGITFTILMDDQDIAKNLYQIQPIPTNFLINSDGRIHNVAYGALNYDLMIQEFEKMN